MGNLRCAPRNLELVRDVNVGAAGMGMAVLVMGVDEIAREE